SVIVRSDFGTALPAKNGTICHVSGRHQRVPPVRSGTSGRPDPTTTPAPEGPKHGRGALAAPQLSARAAGGGLESDSGSWDNIHQPGIEPPGKLDTGVRKHTAEEVGTKKGGRAGGQWPDRLVPR